ncbi:MAG TPA: hypothetical protein VEA69_13875 [Tepidisphaeraceae bacterium]|nr:hypothetical protein [Tepidisphaeraceae bacterium]
MLGTRRKLRLGFGGLLIILLAVGGVSVGVLERCSSAMRAVVGENYRGIEYGHALKDALARLGDAADQWAEPSAELATVRESAGRARADLERHLTLRRSHVTVDPHEATAIAEIDDAWSKYAVAHADALDEYKPLAERRAALGVVGAESGRIRRAAGEIISLNVRNMVEQERRVHRVAVTARTAVYILVAIGGVLATAFVIALGRRSGPRGRP